MAAAQELSPEAAQGMADSAKYVARLFLEPPHYQRIRETLLKRWDRLHSLSAAVRLMEQYGVVLTPEEEERLTKMDEAQQINALVSKMPQQSNDQFQHFFLQLQVLVSTALRVRQGLEEGRPVDVAEALEVADTTGISSYILRVAVVQAGSEAMASKRQFDVWCREADAKLGRLLRGQQDAMAAQKKLAAAEAELAKHCNVQAAKSAKAVMSFAQGSEKAMLGLVFNSWFDTMKLCRLEATVKLDYKERTESLEKNVQQWKATHLRGATRMALRRIEEEQVGILDETFVVWRAEWEDAKFMRENKGKVEALESKLATFKAKSLDASTSVLTRFAAATDQSCVDAAWKEWLHFHREFAREQELLEAQRVTEEKIAKFSESKSAGATRILDSLTGSTDTGLLHLCWQAWLAAWQDFKREAHVEALLCKSQAKLATFSERNKDSGATAMEKARGHMETMLMLRCVASWRLDTKMERTLRLYHAKIDAKRQQLVGVQHMFRNFATQLEGGIKEAPDSGKFFEHAREGRRPSRSESTPGLLPVINAKPGSGRSSGKPGTPHKSMGGSPHLVCLDGGSAIGPKAAWG